MRAILRARKLAEFEKVTVRAEEELLRFCWIVKVGDPVN